MNEKITMKPMLGQLVQEAVKLALIDAGSPGEDERRKWTWDIYSMPLERLQDIDPMALAQNVALRLLGPGGWTVGDVYSGNASPIEIANATFERPDQDPLGEICMDLGLKPEDSP